MIAPLRFGLVGTGIGHSLSPRLHEKAFELSGITGSYALLDCADASAALAVFAQLRLGDLDGLNVTTPFKALALQTADAWLRPASHRSGVFTHPANTLFMQEDRLVASSTDGHGLAAALRSAQVDLAGKRVLLLGAGGACQAIAAELLAAGAAQLRVTNRTPAPAHALVDRLNAVWPHHAHAHDWGEARGLADMDVIVHATLLGHGQVLPDTVAAQLDWLPWQAWAARPPLLADLVYAPELTPVQALARAHGLPVDDRLAQAPIAGTRIQQDNLQIVGIIQYFGQAMLAHQAAGAFELWTGVAVDAQRMLAAILPGATSNT